MSQCLDGEIDRPPRKRDPLPTAQTELLQTPATARAGVHTTRKASASLVMNAIQSHLAVLSTTRMPTITDAARALADRAVEAARTLTRNGEAAEHCWTARFRIARPAANGSFQALDELGQGAVPVFGSRVQAALENRPQPRKRPSVSP